MCKFSNNDFHLAPLEYNIDFQLLLEYYLIIIFYFGALNQNILFIFYGNYNTKLNSYS